MKIINNPSLICEFSGGCTAHVQDILIHPDSNRIIKTEENNGGVNVFFINENKSHYFDEIESSYILGLRRNGNVVCYCDECYYVIDLDNLSILKKMGYSEDSLDNSFILKKSEDNRLRRCAEDVFEENEIFNHNHFTKTLEALKTEYIHDGSVMSISESRYGGSLDLDNYYCDVFLFRDDTVKIFSKINGIYLCEIKIEPCGYLQRAFITPDGKKLIVEAYRGSIRVYSIDINE